MTSVAYLALITLLQPIADTSFAYSQSVGTSILSHLPGEKFIKLAQEIGDHFKKIQNDHSQVKYSDAVDPLYDSSEAAEYLGIKENTLAVWRCVGRYDIEYIKVGRLVKYRKSALDAFLKRRTRGHMGEI
jgi:excisionase family DNA binding protein